MIVYEKTEIGGIPARPDSRAVMEKALIGHTIEAHSPRDVNKLYLAFTRMQASDGSLEELRFLQRQVGESTWHIVLTRDYADRPQFGLQTGYNPKFGRYKRYAEKLVRGEALVLKNEIETKKTRRAWLYHVDPAIRRNLQLLVRPGGMAGHFAMTVAPREAR